MSRILSRAESWEHVYQAVQNINFSAFDYATIKQSIIEYVRLYFPEDFNDFIESSEFIAIIETFAYVGELLAYRLDLNAHENFLPTAQRKESVLRIAKMLSYNPTRNIPARGLVKITSISTTETVYDSAGRSLANARIRWNDTNNPRWKEQFLLVINRILQQKFGTVSPDERVQVDDVLFELYPLDNVPLTRGVQSFSVTASGESLPMELVPVSLNRYGPTERRPENQTSFSILYGSDGLGDASDTTGFFCFTKQGTLQRTVESFDGVTPNQTLDIQVPDINETDVWVNNIHPQTQQILNDGSVEFGRSGEWEEVDLAHAQNIIYNTNPNRNKYEVETLSDDTVRLVFGDGEFSNIPSGMFEVWSRVSANRQLSIPQSAITDQTASFTYVGNDGNTQTITITFSLISSLQNNSPSEDIEHIRKVAPATYYTQDRMVNNRDYNTFMLQDSSILKLRAINRTYSGDSKYIHWHDPSSTYENVKIFGDDLAVYYKDGEASTTIVNQESASVVLYNYVEPLLSSVDFFIRFSLGDIDQTAIRRTFNQTEVDNILSEMTDAALAPTVTLVLYYLKTPIDGENWVLDGTIPDGDYLLDGSVPAPLITITVHTSYEWEISWKTMRVVTESPTTKFWSTNDANRVIAYDTFTSIGDTVNVLKANVDKDGSLLGYNIPLNVVGHELSIDGLPDIHKLAVITKDTNGDGVPDNVKLEELIGPNDYVYLKRDVVGEPYHLVDCSSTDCATAYAADTNSMWKRYSGRYPLNFAWFHYVPRYNLVDPSSTNIIDIFVLPRSYYFEMRRWLDDRTHIMPPPPTSLQLRTDYAKMLDNAMISDTVILHPGKLKILFGKRAIPELRATFKVVRTQTSTLTNNQIKVRVVDAIKRFFAVTQWEFGESFFYTQLSAMIHNEMQADISSIVLVPMHSQNHFGAMFQVIAREDEIFVPSIDIADVDVVDSLTAQTLRSASTC